MFEYWRYKDTLYDNHIVAIFEMFVYLLRQILLHLGVQMCGRYILLFISKRQNCANDVFILLLKIKLTFSYFKG